MATRLYLATTNNSGITPAFDGGWDTAAQAVRRDLYRAKSPLQSIAVSSGADVDAGNALEIQFISPPLAAQTITGTVKAYFQPLDDRDVGDFLSYISIRVVSGDGGTVRGTLLSLGTYGGGSNYYSGSTHTSRAIADGDSLGSVAASDGDRIIVEIGHQSDNSGGDPAYFRNGCPNSTSDLPENETQTTTGVPWIEFSQTLNWQIKDDFNRATLGTTNWEKVLGTNNWATDSSATARPQTAYVDTAMRYVGSFPNDQWAEADIEFTTGGDGAEGAVCVRMDGSGNSYYAQIGNNSITLFKRVAGTRTYLTEGTVTAAANTLYRVRIEVIGTSIVAYFNNVFCCSTTDSSLTAGNPGLFAHTGQTSLYPDFDNFASTDAAVTGSTITPSGIASAEAFGSQTVAPGAVTIQPTGIASAESFGTQKVNQQISPSGIATAEAFGSHSVTPGAVTITPSGIASAEAFGSHTVAPGAVTIAVNGIASAEAFGSASLSLLLTASGIASAETFGSHMVAPGVVTISPTGITTAEAFGAHAVAPGFVTISPSGIASAEQFGVANLNLLLTATGIASAEAFGTASINLILSASGIASAEAFGTALIQSGATFITPAGIATAEAFGSASVLPGAVSIFPSAVASAETFGSHTVAPGAVTIQPTGIASAEAFGTATINLILTANGIGSAEAFGSHTVVVGAVLIQPTGIASAEAFGSAIVQAGVLFISPAGVASAEAFGSHTLQPGAVSISPTGIVSAEAFGTTKLDMAVSPVGIASAEAFGSASLNLLLFPAGIATVEQFGTATVQRGTVQINPAGIASAEAFGAAIVQVGVLFVSPTGIASAEAFGVVTIQPGAVSIQPTGIATAEQFGAQKLNLRLSPTGIATAEQFGTATIQRGAVQINPAGIASAEAFGNPLLVAGAIFILPTGIASAEAFGSAAVSPGTATITAVGVASVESFGSAAIQPGAVTVTATGIASAEAFGTANVLDGAIVTIPSDRRTLLAKWRDARALETQWIHSVMMPGAFRHRLTLELGGSMNTALNQEIKDLVRGDDWVFERNYTGAPSGTNIIQATLTVKASAADLDNAALAQVTITTSLSSDGQITANGSSGTVTLTIKVAHAQTVQATLRQYVYDVQLKHSSGDLVTVERGKIFPLQQITQATS